jgi:isopenicillin N synthase-like dioxygenase
LSRTLRVCNLEDWFAGGERKEHFIQTLGDALRDIGFFALAGHGISKKNIDASYETIERFFNLDQNTKKS